MRNMQKVCVPQGTEIELFSTVSFFTPVFSSAGKSDPPGYIRVMETTCGAREHLERA